MDAVMLQLSRARNRLTTPATLTLPEIASSGLTVSMWWSRSPCRSSSLNSLGTGLHPGGSGFLKCLLWQNWSKGKSWVVLAALCLPVGMQMTWEWGLWFSESKFSAQESIPGMICPCEHFSILCCHCHAHTIWSRAAGATTIACSCWVFVSLLTFFLLWGNCSVAWERVWFPSIRNYDLFTDKETNFLARKCSPLRCLQTSLWISILTWTSCASLSTSSTCCSPAQPRWCLLSWALFSFLSLHPTVRRRLHCYLVQCYVHKIKQKWVQLVLSVCV